MDGDIGDEEDDYHRGVGSLGDSGNALHLDFGEGEWIFSHVKTQQTVHISYTFLCILQKKFLKHLSENKMI